MIKNLITDNIEYEALPLPAMSPRHILAIEHALHEAWKRLKASEVTRKVLREGEEKHITIELRRALEEIRLSGDSGPFSEEQFSQVVRGVELISHDAKHLEKRPDLTIYLKSHRPGVPSSLSGYDGLFIECKVLDRNGADLKKYADNGILRFVNGEYAWAMPHSMMLAYVKCEQSLPSALDTYLKKDGHKTRYSVEKAVTKYRLSQKSPLLCSTQHGRSWSYLRGKKPPGDIEIMHLWLSC